MTKAVEFLLAGTDNTTVHSIGENDMLAHFLDPAHAAVMRIAFFMLVAFLVASRAGAGITTFDDKGAFLTATGATSATGALPDLGEVTPPTTIGTLTFTLGPSATRLFVGTSGVTVGSLVNNNWTLRLPGNEIAITGKENLDVDLASPAFSFGFDFVEAENDPNRGGASFVDSTFTVSLLTLAR